MLGKEADTGDETMTRTEALALTADLRADLVKTQAALKEVTNEMDGRVGHFRLVRLTDKRHDLSARARMICRMIDARMERAA